MNDFKMQTETYPEDKSSYKIADPVHNRACFENSIKTSIRIQVLRKYCRNVFRFRL